MPIHRRAFLAASAIVQKLTGMWVSTALAMEAQALFTAGVRFRSRFLRGLSRKGRVGRVSNGNCQRNIRNIARKVNNPIELDIFLAPGLSGK